MPNPIPDWDVARRLVKYMGFKQIAGELVTVRELTVTLGLGRERLEEVMKEKKIKYKIFSDGEPSGRDLVGIEYVPQTLALDAGVSNRELDNSYRKLIDLEQQGKIRVLRRRSRPNKKQREQMRVTEFWDRPKEPQT